MILTTRPMAPGDRAWCAKSWVESYASSAMARLISLSGTLGDPQRAWHVSGEYWEAWNGLVNTLLDRGLVTVAVDDMGLLAGFVCWEPWESAVAVHYLYVRLMHRKLGVARQLIEELPRGPVIYTHRSRGLARVPPGWTYSIRPLLGAVRAKEAA